MKAHVPILAAGGIVLRGMDATLQFAVIQSRKLETWGLPKGKLAAGEDAITAARREVLEETGHAVTVHEFLGTLFYETNGRPKAVHFWRMEATGAPISALMHDVKAVRWLTLDDAIDRLSHQRERMFLQQAGPIALKMAERQLAWWAAASFQREAAGKILVPAVHVAPAADAFLRDGEGENALVEPVTPRFEKHFAASPAPTVDVTTVDDFNVGGCAMQELVEHDSVRQVREVNDKHIANTNPGEKNPGDKSQAGKALMKKTWGWFVTRPCCTGSLSIGTINELFNKFLPNCLGVVITASRTLAFRVIRVSHWGRMAGVGAISEIRIVLRVDGRT
jgi:8-oxo-dGTP diphosphatase